VKRKRAATRKINRIIASYTSETPRDDAIIQWIIFLHNAPDYSIDNNLFDTRNDC
jgi:hypothetical protein